MALDDFMLHARIVYGDSAGTLFTRRADGQGGSTILPGLGEQPSFRNIGASGMDFFYTDFSLQQIWKQDPVGVFSNLCSWDCPVYHVNYCVQNAKIYFGAYGNIYRCNPDGSELEPIVYSGWHPHISSDGNTMVFTGWDDANGWQIWIYTGLLVPMEYQVFRRHTEGAPGVCEASNPAISPDGTTIAYVTGIMTGATDAAPVTKGARNIATIPWWQNVPPTLRTNAPGNTLTCWGDVHSPAWGRDNNTITFGRSHSSGAWIMAMDDTYLTTGNYAILMSGWAGFGLRPNRVVYDL